MRPIALTFLLCFSALQLSAAAAPESSSPAEQVLRQRVEEFYSLLQAANWTAAEAYVTEETKENFRAQHKSPFLGFQVDTIKIEPDGQSATVTVKVAVFTGFSPTPVTLPRTLRWRRVDGTWFVVIPKADPRPLDSLFESSRTRSAPPPEELTFKGHRYGLGRIEPGQIKVARFPFTNETDHTVTVIEIDTGCECLRAKLEKTEYKPGESGEVAVEFDPTGFERGYAQTIVVKMSPGNTRSLLTVHGYVLPRDAPKPEQGEKPRANLQ